MSDEANQTAPAMGKHPDHFIAEWRAYRGWSQMELGEMVGASHSKISRIETGETELKPSFVKKLARIFRVPPIALITVNPQGDGRQTAEMLTVWANIDPRERDRELRVLRSFESPGNGSKTG